MRFDGAIMVGVAGGTLDRVALGRAAEEAAARSADLLVCHVRERREPSPLQVRPARSSARRQLIASAARAGIGPDDREILVGAVLRELAVRLTPAQWRELCGWLPWDVCSLAGTRLARRLPPREDLVTAVVAGTGLPRPATVGALRTVLEELARIVPVRTIPARFACDVPGL